MFREKCTVLENREVAPGHFCLVLRSPKIARKALPGQFVQILCSDSYDPLLPRPFSFLETTSNSISILYQVVGKGTKVLELVKKGDLLWVLGPLGKGFGSRIGTPKKQTAVLVGGGVGIPPLYHLAKAWASGKGGPKKRSIHVFLGARNKDLLLAEKEFKKLGVGLHVSTNDGSKGHRGFVTEILEDLLKSKERGSVKVYTCGPTSMLKAVSALTSKYRVPCEVSVEVPMACGFGACLGCALKVKGTEGQDHRFAIACCEGPVFCGEEVLWD
ncbi:MAG TPA: dihydroorotate dehydrogenase electron transfer subunit [Candidatus Omnitrophota bacterium]|nr:dihydroorotate dehydrogenase electron transfer subunit [Candidatus Omnitrophota bacterium]